MNGKGINSNTQVLDIVFTRDYLNIREMVTIKPKHSKVRVDLLNEFLVSLIPDCRS